MNVKKHFMAQKADILYAETKLIIIEYYYVLLNQEDTSRSMHL